MMITDERIIELIDEGLIEVDLDTAEVVVRGVALKPQLIGGDRRQPEHKRWTYGLRFDGQRRTIVRSKLVYLAGARIPIPQGFEIHHLDEDKNNDGWSNLIMVTMADHRKIHNQEEIPF